MYSTKNGVGVATPSATVHGYGYEKPCVCGGKAIETAKHAHRDAQFTVGPANARALGKRLVANAEAHFH